MFSPIAVISTLVCYVLLLFVIAQYVEKKTTKNKSVLKSPWLYSLSLAVFHTSWTFYGSVGFASTSGLLFLGIYIGALLGIMLWWVILRKMVAAKESFRITSIADFISTRYRRSQRIAGLVTLIALIGLLPYIALQLKAVVSSFDIITIKQSDSWSSTGLLVTLLMIMFTIIFGVRKLDPTERHQGMIVALVVESLVKLIAFISVGLFVCFSLFDGIGDIYQRMQAANLGYLTAINTHPDSASMWISMIVLSFAGIYLLPRQFHVAVVENTDQNHIKTAMWLFPLYIVAINLFVIPLAAAGILSGLPLESADFFVLLLPQQAGQNLLTLLAFIGGFSAATGMILITTMTLATMVSNHLVLPAIESFTISHKLRTYILQIRWILVALILGGSYWFELEFSDSYILVAIGLLSFVAVLQFAPATFIGMFWQGGNSAGAFAGLSAGFFVWCYTLALPTFVKQGWLNGDILDNGPWHIALLKPEMLFGVEGLSPIPHSVLWSMVFNVSFYVIGSLIYHPNKTERTLTTEFMAALKPLVANRKARPTGLDAYITLSIKMDEAENILSQYLTQDKARDAVLTIADDLQVLDKSHITIIELMEFHRMLEHFLAGSIGAASAHNSLEQSIHYTERESNDFKALYSHLVSEINAQALIDTEDNEQDYLPNGFGMISSLQSQLDTLELTVSEQKKQIESLESKLEARYQEIFEYRMETQRTQIENEELREQISLLSRRES